MSLQGDVGLRSGRLDEERKARGVSGYLNGEWRVERLGGLLPPLTGIRKRIAGDRGRTTLGRTPLGMGFDVVGLELRYRWPLRGLVDVLEQAGPGEFRGRTAFRGRQLGTFRIVRI